MKVTIEGHIYAHQWPNEKVRFTFFDFNPQSNYVQVQEHFVEVEIPDDFDIRIGQVELLKMQREKIRADFAKSITDIERRISELQAIGCEVAQ